jgi:predicted nucleic acid-binding protein
MILIIDTGTWLKLDVLKADNMFDAEQLYNWAEIIVTHHVLKELEYYNCKSFQKEKTKITPIENITIFQDLIKSNFDEADASILSLGKKSPKISIISEDGALLEYARVHHFYAIQLIDLFRSLTEINLITNRLLYHLTKTLRQLKNITKKKEKRILKQ